MKLSLILSYIVGISLLSLGIASLEAADFRDSQLLDAYLRKEFPHLYQTGRPASVANSPYIIEVGPYIENEEEKKSTCQPRPVFKNSSWEHAMGHGVKKSIQHAVGTFTATRVLSFLTNSWIPALSCQKIATSSALLCAFTALACRYKKHVMGYFETEQSCESTLDLASVLLPGLSPSLLSIVAASTGYYALKGPYYPS